MPKAKSRKMTVRTAFLVTVVTVLVWLLAESRTVRSQPADLSPRIEVGNASGLVVRAAPGEVFPEVVEVSFVGSTAGLDAVLRSLQGRLVLRVGIDVPASAGVHDVDLRDVLRGQEAILSAGVSVEEVNPERLRVEVDTLGTASVVVRAEYPDGVLFEAAGTPKAVPATLTARGPSSVLARLAGREAVVRLESGMLAPMLPGRAETVADLSVETPAVEDAWALTFEPKRVDVTLQLRSRTATLTLEAMPVQVLMAPGEVGQWVVTLDPGREDLVGVEVTGPSDQVERLRTREVVPTAVISLSFEDLERGVETAPAMIQGLPPGVRVVPGTDLSVRLTVRRTGGEVTAVPVGVED